MASIRWLYMPGTLRRPSFSRWRFVTHRSICPGLHHRLQIQIPPGGSFRGFAAPLVMPGGRFTRPDIITNNIMSTDSAKEVLQAISNEITNPDLNLINVSAAIVRIAHLQDTLTADVRADPQFRVLFALGRSMLRSVAKRGKTSEHRICGNIFWAVAKMDQQMSAEIASLRAASLEAVKATASHMNEQGISNSVWAVAVLQLPQAERDEVLDACATRLPDVLNKLEPQHVANILWGTASLRNRAVRLLPKIPLLQRAAERVLPDVNKQDIVDILWACAKLKDVPELLTVVPMFVPLVHKHLSELSARRLAMVIWSIAELHQESAASVQFLPQLLGAFTKVDPGKLSPQDMSGVLWAVATLGELREVEAKRGKLCKLACQLDGTFGASDVAVTLWSVGLPNLDPAASAPLLQRMCKEARSTLSSFGPLQISNACLGLALSGWKDASLMAAFADAMVKKIHSADTDVATMCLPPVMYSLAKLQMPGHQPLMNVCVATFNSVVSTVSDVALGDLAWSF
ncbi:unnamed protein product, partial [Symbiodinium microadriaticum]